MSVPDIGSDLRYDRDDAVVTVALNRPSKKNALTEEMIDDFVTAVRFADEDDAVRSVIITGTGDAFCAGGDIGTTNAAVAESVSEDSFGPGDDHWAVSFRFDDIDTPLIGAVNGICAGAGMEIIHMTDIRIAAADAQFSHPEAELGVFPAGGATVRLPRQIPYSYAMQMLLTAEFFPAKFARDAGLVSELVEGDVRERAYEIACSVAANSPTAVQAIKRSVRETADQEQRDAFLHEAAIAREVWASDDAEEGIKAFQEGREPSF